MIGGGHPLLPEILVQSDPTSSTINSSGDEIANVNFLCDDVVHALKYNTLA